MVKRTCFLPSEQKHGTRTDPAECLKVFEDGANEYNELIVVRGIPVYSHCKHHLAPFFGQVTIVYVTDGIEEIVDTTNHGGCPA